MTIKTNINTITISKEIDLTTKQYKELIEGYDQVVLNKCGNITRFLSVSSNLHALRIKNCSIDPNSAKLCTYLLVFIEFKNVTGLTEEWLDVHTNNTCQFTIKRSPINLSIYNERNVTKKSCRKAIKRVLKNRQKRRMRSAAVNQRAQSRMYEISKGQADMLYRQMESNEDTMFTGSRKQ